jgi:hypothetical protein
MHRFIIVITVLICFTDRCHGQSFNEQLLKLEYQIFQEQNDTVRANLLLQKADLYIDSGIVSTSFLQEIKRVDFQFLDSLNRQRFLWNAALASHLLHDPNYALHYLRELQDTTENMERIVLSALVYSNYDPEKCRAIILDHPELEALNCILATSAYSMKGKKWILVSSAVVPGSGMMINGEFLKGTTALLLTAGSVIGLRWMAIHQLYVNLFGWGSNLGLKFYLGNLRLTNRLTSEKVSEKRSEMANSCEAELLNLLNKYPISFHKK